MSKEAKNPETVEADFFGGEETCIADLPRYAIGDPATAQGETPVLARLDCFYEDTMAQTIEGKTRFSHRVRPAQPIDGNKRIILWGNYQLDSVLPTLEPGTKVRVSYKGMRALPGKRSLKEIEIVTATSARHRSHPYAEALGATTVADTAEG